jgi:hypothetical protein
MVNSFLSSLFEAIIVPVVTFSLVCAVLWSLDVLNYSSAHRSLLTDMRTTGHLEQGAVYCHRNSTGK